MVSPMAISMHSDRLVQNTITVASRIKLLPPQIEDLDVPRNIGIHVHGRGIRGRATITTKSTMKFGHGLDS